MPEFILPAEADRCPHCGEVLRDPPNCCETMEAEYRRELNRRLIEDENGDVVPKLDERDYCPVCGSRLEYCECADWKQGAF